MGPVAGAEPDCFSTHRFKGYVLVSPVCYSSKCWTAVGLTAIYPECLCRDKDSLQEWAAWVTGLNTMLQAQVPVNMSPS